MSKHLDPITLKILWQRLISIVDEADASVANTAFSSLLRDAHDYTCIFTDSRGNELVQGSLCTPGQAGAMTLGMKKVIKTFPSYKPGDVIILNDPWLLSGHLNHICVMSPIFFKNKLVAFTACIFHHADIGGRVSSDNREVYEEGLFIPPTKLYDSGKVNEELINLIRCNVRTPDAVIGDIRSQVASNHVCSGKLIEMMSDEKLDDLDELSGEIISRTQNSMQEAISKIPDGEYTYNGSVEGSGTHEDIRICVNVKVVGSEIIIDLAGTAPQVNWGVNVVYNFTYAYAFMAVKSALDPVIPINEGAIRPIKLLAPLGCVLNCKFPAAVSARMQIGHFMTEMIFRAISKAVPDKIMAGSGGTPAQTNIFYGKDHNNKPWLTMIIRGGGMGANIKQDGHHCAIFPANGANTPVEIIESETPLLVVERSLNKNSGGPGKNRGGLGRKMVLELPNENVSQKRPVSIAVQAGRFKYPPEGIFGGGNGTKSKFLKNGIPCDPSTLTLAFPGDKIEFHSSGGGGFGNPFERDPGQVAIDVKNGYLDTEKALEEYGVVFKNTLDIDFEATKLYRENL